MAHEMNDGAAYLQALKQAGNSSSGGSAAAPGVAPQSDAEHATRNASPQYSGAEKRRSPRYQCEGSAEIQEDGHDVRTWATFTDISMHGCYVEATATYPVGTKLSLKLAANGFQVSTKGTVRATYPYLGMGIAFTETSQDDQARLRSLLQTVSRPSVIMGPGVVSSLAASASLESVPLISDPTKAIQALMRFFEERQVLMREEFLQILTKSQNVVVPKS